MKWTKVWLADGSETILKIAPAFIEEAADNGEVIPDIDGHLVDLALVDSWAAVSPPD